MGTVVLDISMSLDGFIAGPDDTPAQPLGTGGQRLHQWIRDPTDTTLQSVRDSSGSIVSGRRTYDLVRGWDGSHPIACVPVFVVTHRMPNDAPVGATFFTFVTRGVENAIEQARAAAGERNVYVLGGANVAQQCINARLLDEIHLHVAPLLLGSGIRLFDHIDRSIELHQVSLIEGSGVSHVRLRVPARN